MSCEDILNKAMLDEFSFDDIYIKNDKENFIRNIENFYEDVK